jgi:hypothetical protein
MFYGHHLFSNDTQAIIYSKRPARISNKQIAGLTQLQSDRIAFIELRVRLTVNWGDTPSRHGVAVWPDQQRPPGTLYQAGQ